jgi:hypothetical protein
MGNESDKCPIVLNGKVFHITSNLEKALRQFREENEFRANFKLWIDALCINQEDLQERAREVQRMRDIYGSCWSVIAWLGEESYRSGSALQLVEDLAEYEETGCVEQIELCLRTQPQFLGQGRRLALQELMDRDYWSRLWIVQELIMEARSTWLRCGKSSMKWRTFCRGVAALAEHLWLVKDRSLRADVFICEANRDPVWTTSSLHLVYLDLSALSRQEQRTDENFSFGRLLDLANAADCKDDRDKVYSIIGLMPSNIARLLKPNYTLPVRHVYLLAAKAFITAQKNLEPIREDNPWGPSECPSGQQTGSMKAECVGLELRHQYGDHTSCSLGHRFPTMRRIEQAETSSILEPSPQPSACWAVKQSSLTAFVVSHRVA